MNFRHGQLYRSIQASRPREQGFSLIEIIVVIVVLGVLATSISSFIGFGTQVYTDASDRDKIVSSARFVIERLNRELRAAVPNSIRITSNNINTANAKQCLEFTPIVLGTIYTDIPVAPEPASNKIKVVAFDEALFNSGFTPDLHVGSYILNASDFYSDSSNKIFTLQNNAISKSGNEWTLTIDVSDTFAEESATERLYFFNHAVSYCLQNFRLTRHEQYSRNGDNTPNSLGVLMAENINMHDGSTLIPPFGYTEATQLRNAMVLIKLTFDNNFEQVIFNNEIQVSNAP